MTLRLPLKDLKTMGGDCLVALLQVENAGPILGAAEYELRKPSQVLKRIPQNKTGRLTDPFDALPLE